MAVGQSRIDLPDPFPQLVAGLEEVRGADAARIAQCRMVAHGHFECRITRRRARIRFNQRTGASDIRSSPGGRKQPSWALIANLRMDPYERGMKEGGGALEFLGRNMWLLVPIQGKIKKFFADFNDFPNQEGSTLNPSGIDYGMLRQQAALQHLQDVERLAPP